MDSVLVKALKLERQPVALIHTDEPTDGARRSPKTAGRCVMSRLVEAAAGTTVVLERKTIPCPGGSIGLGYTDRYDHMSGGVAGLCRFLAEDERYVKSPKLARRFIDGLPTVKIEQRYVMLIPLDSLDEKTEPVSVSFLVNPDQLSALVVLSNYGREATDNVIIPMGAGCHQIGIYVYREAERDRPRAVVGLTDVSARLFVNRRLGDRYLTFSVPWRMFLELEGNVPGSFLERATWRKLVNRRGGHDESR